MCGIRENRRGRSLKVPYLDPMLPLKTQQNNSPLVVYGFTSAMSVPFCEGHSIALRRKGMAATVVSSPGVELETLGIREGVPTFAVPMKREIAPLSDLVSLWRLWRLLTRLRPAITNFGNPKAGLLGGVASLLARVPCRIYTLYGLRLETTSGLKRTVLLTTEWISCHCAHRVICVSRSLRARAIQLGVVDAARAVVLAKGGCNGIGVQRFESSAENVALARGLRHDLSLPDGVPVVGFVGRFTRDKGITELIDAYDRLRPRFPDLRILLVGDFEDGDPVPHGTRTRIEQEPNVIQTGWVGNTAPYYQLMDVLAFPTYREGFGMVSVEANASGKPVVTTNATGAIDSVADGVTGLVVPVGDSRALASALGRLLSDPALRERMGAAGTERAIREFQQETLVDAAIKQYNDVLSSRLARAESSTVQSGWRLSVKRVLDATFALGGLIVLFPVLLAISLLILITMGRPIFFRQRRPGKNQAPFTPLKFRTMGNETDESGKLLSDGERLTRLGRLLRTTSLDELPQLWNVLRGDLSLVGPRPLLTEYLGRYTAEQMRRHDVLPGITGWAQVNGRNAISWPEKFDLDLWYVDHWSLKLDSYILCKTLWQVVKRDGISQPGHATMPEYRGVTGNTDHEHIA
jgi:lipopolysaccharide/colanic/teichoic acid biosynthesis glycosyltransferase